MGIKMKKNQLKIGAIISYLQTGLNIIIAIVYTPVMIRLLGRSDYGLYNTMSSVISIIALLNLGFGNTYIKYYSMYAKGKNRESISRLNGLFFIIFSAIGLIAGICGVTIAENLFLVFSNGLTEYEYKTAKLLMYMLTINMSFSFVMNIFSCIISANERFIYLKLIGLARIVISPLITIPVLLAGYGSIGMVVVTVVLSFICDILYAIYVVCVLKEKFTFHKFDRGVYKDIFCYTILIAIHLIVDQVNWNVDKVLLGRFRGTESVAVYSIGFSLYSHFLTIGVTIVNMFTPKVHKIVTQYGEDKEYLRKALTDLFVKIGRSQYAILIPVIIGFIFFGKSFVEIWAGQEYLNAYYITLLLIVPGSIDIIQNIGIEIQRAENLHAFRAVVYGVMAIINIVVSVILCQKYGEIGCAIGTAISLVIVQGVIINIYYYKKCEIDVIAFWKSIIKMSKGVVFPIVYGSIIRLIKSNFSIIELIFAIGGFVGVYIVSMYKYGLESNEKSILKSVIKKEVTF